MPLDDVDCWGYAVDGRFGTASGHATPGAAVRQHLDDARRIAERIQDDSVREALLAALAAAHRESAD